MSTLGDLVASVHSSLHSFTGLQEVSTWLSSAVDADDLSFPVASSDAILKGIAEIDDELVYVTASDAGSVAIAPYGRGYRGSVAASHLANTQVTFDPSFPRLEIKRAIDQCVAGLYPQLYQIKTTDLTFSAVAVGHELPADCEQVLGVKWEAPGPLNYWDKIYEWEFDSASPEATGRVLNILDGGILPGATVRVVYQARFGAFVSGASTLASAGLSESFADLILYGVTSRLVRFLDPSRLQTTSVENLSRAQVVQVGDAGKIANQLYAMYQQRLAEERTRLLQLTPPQIHFTR